MSERSIDLVGRIIIQKGGNFASPKVLSIIEIMATPKFTHLHVHSHYSLLDGLPKIPDLVARAKELGMDSLALTDHGVLYGAIEFYKACKAQEIKPIIGIETYVAPNGMENKRPNIDDTRYHLILLAKNEEGYRNLLALSTKAYLEGYYYKPRIDKKLLREHGKGLIGLSACLSGEIPRLLLGNHTVDAERSLQEYEDIFGKGNFYLEIQNHPKIPEQAKLNSFLIDLSRKTGAPLVATGDIHYLHKEDSEAQDVLMAINTNHKTFDNERLSMREEDFSMHSPEEMASFFPEIPEAVENTQKIANECTLQIELGKTQLPYYEIPNGKSDSEYLRELCEAGIGRRYAEVTPEIRQRLDYELDAISKTGFSSYFLVVQDFVNWAKNNGIVVGPGRGSAAGSLVAYVLNITNVDPLRYGLLFERFINPERISPPDIDLDFTDLRRDEVLEYVAKKYGREHVAQIVTFGTMKARLVVRDVARVLGFPYQLGDTIAKSIPFGFDLARALAESDELKAVYDTNADAKRVIDTARKLEGVARHASTHACGVLITRDPLTHSVPLQLATKHGGAKNGENTNEKNVVAQYEMHAIEDLGLLKMDFLGLKNLSIIESTLRIIEKNHGVKVDIDTIPLDDSKSFELLQRAETTGVFQLESGGMRRYLLELKPSELEDIIAMVALYRPGPMELIPTYINRKHGKEKIEYLHPKLEPILKNTYGIGVYQEQMMQIARDLAGYTLPQADTLRKAIGKKIRALLDEQREKLITGMRANDIPVKTAEAIWELFPPFARYGFNRSHAACYATVAYQTAYLKAHYPAEFMAALLTADLGDIERTAFLVGECRKMRINVLPPDVNESDERFTVVNSTTLRFGLAAIKNVGENIVQVIIQERNQNGRFASMADFIERIHHKDLNKKSLESLTRAGALDALAERGQLLANLDQLLEHARALGRSQSQGQVSLFASLPNDTGAALRLQPALPASKHEKLVWEKELLGLYVSSHPLEDFRERLSRKATPIARLAVTAMDGRATIGGVVTGMKKILTKTGKPMLFVGMEDLSGKIETVVFPDSLERNPACWQQDKVLLISGRLSNRDGTLKLLCEAAEEVL